MAVQNTQGIIWCYVNHQCEILIVRLSVQSCAGPVSVMTTELSGVRNNPRFGLLTPRFQIFGKLVQRVDLCIIEACVCDNIGVALGVLGNRVDPRQIIRVNSVDDLLAYSWDLNKVYTRPGVVEDPIRLNI